MKKHAYFVRTPRTINDLRCPHPIECEKNYEIAKEIVLEEIDYENFIYDMLADRKFIEDNFTLCSEGEIIKCLYIHMKDENEGVLVIPEDNCYVKYAAYVIYQ